MTHTVIYHRHKKVGDAASRITPTSNEGIRAANHILVKEAGAPDLTGDECAALKASLEALAAKTMSVATYQNTNEKSQGYKPRGIPGQASHRCRYRAR